MTYATYLPVTQDILDLAKAGLSKAARAYQQLPHKLNDGTEVVPSLTVARNILMFWELRSFPVVISVGSYELRHTKEN